MGTQEISLWQQERESATKIVILYKDSYFCVTRVSTVAVVVGIHCLTSMDVKKSRKIGPAEWEVPVYSGKP